MTSFFEVAYAQIVAGMSPEEGGMEECRKIQMSSELLQNDCEGCTEKPFCGFRANTAIAKCRNVIERIKHASWLLDVAEVTGGIGGIGDLMAWELQSMILFRRAIRKAESEYQKKLERDRETQTAANVKR